VTPFSYENLKNEAEDIIGLLRGYFWHTTSVEGFQTINAQEAIKVNRGDLPNAYAQSRVSNCFEEGAISLFDVITHRDADLVGDDLLMLDKWPEVMFRHRPTVLLGMELASIATNLLFYPEVKRRRGFGGIIPRIEVCHVGDIPVSLVKRVGIWSNGSRSNIRFYSSLSDGISAVLQSPGLV
jgi:hypothetical protein